MNYTWFNYFVCFQQHINHNQQQTGTKYVHNQNHAWVVHAIALTVHKKSCMLFQFKKNCNLFFSSNLPFTKKRKEKILKIYPIHYVKPTVKRTWERGWSSPLFIIFFQFCIFFQFQYFTDSPKMALPQWKQKQNETCSLDMGTQCFCVHDRALQTSSCTRKFVHWQNVIFSSLSRVFCFSWWSTRS